MIIWQRPDSKDGVCGVFFVALTPPGEQIPVDLFMGFERAVYKRLRKDRPDSSRDCFAKAVNSTRLL